MPAFSRKRGNKWRVMENKAHPKLVRNNSGTPVDGGGHSTKMKADAQARAINASQNKGSK
jgi:hypothetical protein